MAIAEAGSAASATATSAPLYVRVDEVRQETDTVRSYKLVALDGSDLPAFTAGAHIGIVMPGRITRYYSIASAPQVRSHWRIGVAREDAGRGGSLLVHRKLSVGKMLKLHRPRNLFPLAPQGRHLLVAGGIGITPMLSMAADLLHRGQAFELVVCVRDAASLPFADEVAALAHRAPVRVLYTRDGRPDFTALLAEPDDDRHVYICGSDPFMRAVQQAATHWPADRVHLESFTPVTALDGDTAFVVEARASGKTFNVAPDQTILQALRENGVEIDSVCENGTCGTCRVRWIEGKPEHRDHVLGAADRQTHLMACVSRSREFLALDL